MNVDREITTDQQGHPRQWSARIWLGNGKNRTAHIVYGSTLVELRERAAEWISVTRPRSFFADRIARSESDKQRNYGYFRRSNTDEDLDGTWRAVHDGYEIEVDETFAGALEAFTRMI